MKGELPMERQAVQVQLDHVFAGLGGRAWQPQHQSIVEHGLCLGIAQPP